MKTLLVADYREGKVLNSTYELVAFAKQIGAESAMFLVAGEILCLLMKALSIWRMLTGTVNLIRRRTSSCSSMLSPRNSRT